MFIALYAYTCATVKKKVCCLLSSVAQPDFALLVVTGGVFPTFVRFQEVSVLFCTYIHASNNNNYQYFVSAKL